MNLAKYQIGILNKKEKKNLIKNIHLVQPYIANCLGEVLFTAEHWKKNVINFKNEFYIANYSKFAFSKFYFFVRQHFFVFP